MNKCLCGCGQDCRKKYFPGHNLKLFVIKGQKHHNWKGGLSNDIEYKKRYSKIYGKIYRKNQCKKKLRDYLKEHYKNNKKQHKQRVGRWLNKNGNREKMAIAQRKYYKENRLLHISKTYVVQFLKIKSRDDKELFDLLTAYRQFLRLSKEALEWKNQK